MSLYLDGITQFYQYICRVLPEISRQKISLEEMQRRCMPQNRITTSASCGFTFFEKHHTDMLCSAFFALYPGVDIKNTISFVLSLYLLSDTLDTHRSKADITDDIEIHKLYSCLSGAVDPSRSTSCALSSLSDAAISQNAESVSPLCLSIQCRLQLSILPAFAPVAPKLKKLMQYYVDLQSYKHYPPKLRAEYLEAWSQLYLKRYPGIFPWEFIAASSSFIGIAALYASASNPKLTAEDVRLLDEACFPWLCGLDSLLHAYIYAQSSSNAGGLNFTAFYNNLKTCEERILFFAQEAEKACMKLKESSFFIHIINTLIGMYLSAPEANLGMLKLTSKNILQNGPAHFVFYRNLCKLLRLCIR